MQIIADVTETSKVVQDDLTFILIVLSESNMSEINVITHFT